MVVQVSARKLSVPHACACCGGAADGEFDAAHTRTTGKRVVRTDTRTWSFPCCGRCLAHVARWNSAGNLALVTVLIGVGLGIFLGLAAAALGIMVFIASLPVALVVASRRRAEARAAMSPTCASVGAPVSYLGWNSSVHSFWFASLEYAGDFGRANGRALINVSPELRSLLQVAPSSAQPRRPLDAAGSTPAPLAPAPLHAAPPPARAPVAPRRPTDHDTVLDWIEKIEGYKGPVARANALRRALDEVHDAAARHRLVSAAAKIEVAAVLEKVDSLASPAAKRRHLEKAIDALRNDAVPDELQAEELRELASRLASL